MKALLRWSCIPLALAAVVACHSDDSSGASPSQPASVDAGGAEAAAAIDTVDYLVVAANPLANAAGVLKSYRETTGHKVAVGLVADILGDETARAAASAKIHDWVKARYDKRDPARPFFLVLLGDATDAETVDATVVPAGEFVDFNKAKVLTDNVYADMDGDDLPDLAVGRIAVSTEAEAALVIQKTEDYDSRYEVGAWNRRLSIFASTAGFTPDIDAQIESMVFKVVEEIPYDFDLNFTYAKQASPFVYIPEKFSDKVYDRMNEGSLMMTYVGHGYENGFADLEWSGKAYPILDTSKISTINVTHKVPVLSLIACLTGRFTAGESLSERILKTPAGPVAVLSSTEESHPYANAVFIREVAQTVTTERVGTVGEIFARAKRRSIQNAADPIRADIDQQVASLLTPDQRKGLLQSHLYMYELFGDPAARVAYPKGTAKVTGTTTAKAGADLALSLSAPGIVNGGSALVTLEDRRSSTPRDIATVPADGDPNRDSVIAANYDKANDRVLAKQTVTLANGAADVKLTVPANVAPGEYWVKVYADDGHQADAAGSVKITVE